MMNLYIMIGLSIVCAIGTLWMPTAHLEIREEIEKRNREK